MMMASEANVKAELHLVKTLIESDKYSNLQSIYERYCRLLCRRKIKKSPTISCVVDDQAWKIVQSQGLEEYLKKDGSQNKMKPIRISADGNCLYNAVSMHLIGNESLHLVLRLLTSIELFHHWAHYNTEINKLALNGDKMKLIKLMFRFSSTDEVTVESQMQSAFKHEASKNCDNGAFSSLICLCALSSVVNTPIKSIYSPKKITKIFPLFTRTFKPRESSKNSPITLLWTSTESLSDYTKPNHFVLCLDIRSPQTVTPMASISQISQAVDAINENKKRQSFITFKPLKKIRLSGVHTQTPELNQSEPSLLPTQRSISSVTSPMFETSTSLSMPEQKSPVPVSSHLPTLTSQGSIPAVTSTIQSPTATPKQESPVPISSHPPTLTSQSSIPSVTSTIKSPSTTPKQESPVPISSYPLTPTTKSSIPEVSSSAKTLTDSKRAVNAKKCKDPCCSGQLPARGKPIKSIEDCDPNDIGVVFKKIGGMSDAEKLDFAENVWKPPPDFIFPKHYANGRHWKINPAYLTSDSPKYLPWLCYSSYFDGVFCLPCAVFGSSFANSKLQKLYSEPFTRWNGAPTRWKEHNDSNMHKNSVATMQLSLDKSRGKRESINVIMDKSRLKRIRENREKLLPILKTVIFCARQNIPFRGHRDDSKHETLSGNPGNFKALLDFRIDSGDKILENHFKTAPANATYKSKTIQNEMINCVGKFIKKKIADDIKKTRFFSTIGDEASDCSQIEELSLVLRFIGSNGEIREEFTGFLACQSTSAEYLTGKLKTAVNELSLDLNNLRGQCYDGAGNMAGAKSGVSTRILQEFPKALYFHCSSHRLNLAIVSCSKILGVKNMMDAAKKATDIFSFSSKKKELLRNNISQMIPENRRSTVLDVCRTRWIQRIDGLERIEEMMEPIVETLRMIADNHDGTYAREARSDAQGVYWTFKSFQFIVHLIIVRHIIAYTLPITMEFQKVKIDVLAVYDAIDTVVKSLESCRRKVDEEHKDWFAEAIKLGDKMDVKPAVKRRVGQQLHRENYSTDDPEEYYKLSLTIPFLDMVISEMKSRFSMEHRIHLGGLAAIPTEAVKNDTDWKECLRRFATQYQSDMPRPMHFEAELDQWYIYWQEQSKSKAKIPETISSTLTTINNKKEWFPNIYAILCLIAVVPASSNSCERSISKLRLIKTYLRSTMTENRLSNLAVININRDCELDLEEILNIFARDYPHRLELVDILDTDV